MSELPLYFFQTPLSFLHWKRLPCKETKPRKLKSCSVFRWRSYERVPVLKYFAGSRGVARVRECHIPSMNFIGQQQNKSFDVTEINLWLEFADVIFGGTSDSRKYVCVPRLLVNLPSLYHTLLAYLQDLNSITTADVDNVPDKIIWNNQNIVINGKSIFYSSWLRKALSISAA